MEPSNLDCVAVLGGLSAVEATFLLIFLAMLRPAVDPDTGEQPVGFVRSYGLMASWVICFVVLSVLTMISIVPGCIILSIIGWWTVALTLFQLTIRQTFKVNIAMGVLTFATVLALAP